MSDYSDLMQLIGITGVVVVLGAIVCFYTFRVYWRTRQRSMAFLGVGFGLISAGAALSWWAFWFAGWTAVQCQIGTVGVSTVGFVSFIYSLRTRSG